MPLRPDGRLQSWNTNGGWNATVKEPRQLDRDTRGDLHNGQRNRTRMNPHLKTQLTRSHPREYLRYGSRGCADSLPLGGQSTPSQQEEEPPATLITPPPPPKKRRRFTYQTIQLQRESIHAFLEHLDACFGQKEEASRTRSWYKEIPLPLQVETPKSFYQAFTDKRTMPISHYTFCYGIIPAYKLNTIH
ncbi:hypothetical protein F5883DRAFT_653479 [Diaporthe sp. PMI_573]|nr:hypothetical protein F5883DRAFT_653479 [Diaporthaceae sp. PMI_573]